MPSGRQGSIHLFRLAGVDLYLHWSWFLIAAYEIQLRRGNYSSVMWNVLEYLALFAIPVLARKDSSLRAPLWMKVLACSAFLLTLLFVVLSIFPIIPVASQSAYSAKTVAVIVLANLAGLVLYYKRPKPN